jgi:hypothetical protein
MLKKSMAGAAAVCACMLYLGAIGAGPASATWTESCTNTKVTEFTQTWYTDAQCQNKNVLGKYHRLVRKPLGSIWTHSLIIPFAEHQVSATISGVKLTVGCEEQTNTSGVAENFEELGIEKVRGKEMVNVYSECKVKAPAEKGCKVAEPITTTKLKTLAAQPEATQKVWLEPESGTKIATLSISSCSIGALNGERELTGTMVGVVPATETEQSQVEFTTSSGSSLKLAGQSATYTGEMEAEGEMEVEGKKENIGLLFYGE